MVVFPDDNRQVIVQKLALVVDDRPDVEIDLTQDLKLIAKKVNWFFYNFTRYSYNFSTVPSWFSDIEFSDNLWFSDYFLKTIIQFTT